MTVEVPHALAQLSASGAGAWSFGVHGWRMIVISMLLYFVYAGWSVDGLNVFVPALSERHAWSSGQLLALVGPAALFGVPGAAFFGRLAMNCGPRRVMVGCLIGTAVVVFWFGQIRSLWEFAASLMLINFLGAGFGFVGPGTLLAQWFPRRKGLALAIATSGFPLATAAFVPLINAMMGLLDLPRSAAIWAGILIALAAVTWFYVRDTPEELGAHPDNEPGAPHADASAIASYRSAFNVGRLLRDRDVWLVGIGWGCLWMVTVGIVVQLVPRLESVGYTNREAIGLLSLAAVFALPAGCCEDSWINGSEHEPPVHYMRQCISRRWCC